MRLADNPALQAAIASKGPVVCLFLLEEDDRLRPHGGAQAWWLDKSLKALKTDIENRGGQLVLRRGQAQLVLDQLIRETGAGSVFWNRRYGSAERDIDTSIKAALNDRQIHVESFNGTLLTEPWSRKTGSGGYYRVFTPYWKSLRANYTPPSPLPAPDRLDGGTRLTTDALESWKLHPTQPDWSTGFSDYWAPGEAGALARLNNFCKTGLTSYDPQRNRPDLQDGTSRLSPHLAWGEIAPGRIWRTVRHSVELGEANENSAMVFLSEVAWRDFAYVLLYHCPNLARQNYNPSFDHMPWRTDPQALEAWQGGQTGYPIVDAGLRQLWQTGWMHNRVRMIVASFLTKHLLLPWQLGEAWFWDTLVDADPASNAAGWQWAAGSGADAAPYFRVFNPISQGEKFDETGGYVRQWCPELSGLPRKHLYAPWEADAVTLAKAGIRLGDTYPKPLIDHKEGRQRALDAYNILKQRRDAA